MKAIKSNKMNNKNTPVEQPNEDNTEDHTEQPKRLPKFLKSYSKFSKPQLTIFMLAFAVIGGYFLWKSLAVSPDLNGRPISVSGELELLHADDFNIDKNGKVDPDTRHWKSTDMYSLITADGHKYNLVFPGQGHGPGLLSHSKVTVNGTLQDNNIILAESGGTSVSVLSAATVTAVSGVSKVAVVLFNFSDDTSQPFTPQAAKDVVFAAPNSVNDYYRRSSYGSFSLGGITDPTGDVYGWVTISSAKASGCNYSTWSNEADAAVQATGVDLSAYDHIIYSFPSSNCSFGGISQQPGRLSWNNGQLSTAWHEFGHNLGLSHANGYYCNDSFGFVTSISSACNSKEYADGFDIMGGPNGRSNLRVLNGFHKEQLGWLGASNIQTVTASGDYTVNALEPMSSGVQLIKIPRTISHKTPLDYIYLEYLQPLGNQTDPQPFGTVVREAGPISSNSNLIDNDPEKLNFNRSSGSSLAIGRTFTDPDHSISVTPVLATDSSVKLHITVGRASASANNAACVSIVATPDTFTLGGSAFNATIVMKNNGTTTWNAADYKLGSMINADYLYGGNTRLALSSSVSPGGTATFSGSFSAPYGLNFYSQELFNWRMVNTATSEWFGQPCYKKIIVNQNPDQPAAPQNLHATAVTSSSVSLSWDLSVTNYDIWGYKILRTSSKGTFLAGLANSVPGSFTDSGLSSRTSYTYKVVTISNNTLDSPPSAPITVTTPR